MPETVLLTSEIQEVIEIYESAIGHTATRTWPMIEKYGEIEALSRLVVSADLQKGFKVLRDKGLPKGQENSLNMLLTRFTTIRHRSSDRNSWC